MKLIFRLVTVLCYFLPCTFFFTTCHHSPIELRFAYNQREADKNIIDEKNSTVVETSIDTIQNSRQFISDTNKTTIVATDTLVETNKIISDSTAKVDNFSDKLFKRIIMPTDTSLSGFGTILYFKNLTGKIVIGISLAISLSLLFAFKFIKSRKAKKYLLWTSVFCITIFIVDSMISDVTLLYGTWTLLLILLFQIYLEHKNEMAVSARYA